LYWYFQQIQCLKIKNYAVYNIHRLAWGSFACVTTGQPFRHFKVCVFGPILCYLQMNKIVFNFKRNYIGTAFIRHVSAFTYKIFINIQYFFYWKKHSRGVIYILRKYSVSKSYSLKLSVTRLYRDIYSFLCNVIPFKV
jgi:predicted lipase